MNIKDYSPLISPFLVSGVPFDPFHIAPNAKKEKKILDLHLFHIILNIAALGSMPCWTGIKTKVIGLIFFYIFRNEKANHGAVAWGHVYIQAKLVFQKRGEKSNGKPSIRAKYHFKRGLLFFLHFGGFF